MYIFVGRGLGEAPSCASTNCSAISVGRFDSQPADLQRVLTNSFPDPAGWFRNLDPERRFALTSIEPDSARLGRNGMRRTPRPRPAAKRGRYGQRPGQRKPRSTPERREAFQRRMRERLETARRKFEEEVRRTQERIERWAEEGSLPKTGRERAIRVILKFWELWGELSTSWDETHKSFRDMLSRRLNLERQARVSEIDPEIVRVRAALQELDKEFFEHVTRWETQLRDWRGREWSLRSIIEAAINVGTLLFEYLKTAMQVRAKLRGLQNAIGRISLSMDISMPWRPQPPSIRPAD